MFELVGPHRDLISVVGNSTESPNGNLPVAVGGAGSAQHHWRGRHVPTTMVFEATY